jgi:hypothetical protein
MKNRGLLVSLLIAVLVCGANGQPTTTAPATDERKTPAEWLQVIKAQNIECRKYEDAHPADTLVSYGATQIFPAYHSVDHIAQWPAKYREGYQAYQKWWKSDGEAEFKKWRVAGFPVTSDPHYYLLFVIAMTMSDTPGADAPDITKYKRTIVDRGRKLFLQGCSGQKLSQSELAELRLYAMYFGQINVWPPCQLPSYLGWMDTIAVGCNMDQGSVGTVAPDFTLPQMEEILARPTYSDKDPYDEMNVFRPAILTGILNVMSGYEATPASHKGRPWVQAKPYAHEFQHPVTLSSFRGKKPVLLMFEDASDTWFCCGHVVPLWGPLYEAMHDRVGIFFVHTTIPDQIGPGYPGGDMSIPGQKSLQAATPEQRARTAKMCYMLFPLLPVPYLLDDPAQHVKNAYRCGGGETSSVLIDLQGTISFSLFLQPHCNDYMWLDSHATFSVPARDERVMNLVESNLKTLLDAHGVWTKDMKVTIPDWQLSPTAENTQLKSVDTKAGLITIADKDNKLLTIAVDGGCRILLGPKRGTIADLQPGQTMSIYYDQQPANGSSGVARLIATPDAYQNYWCAGLWVPAVVESVDPQKSTIQAKLTLSEQDCKGAAFWKTASPEMIQALGNNAAGVQQTFDILCPKSGRELTLHADRATEIFLDGMKAKLPTLKPGDHLGIPLTDLQSNDAWPTFIRVYRY